MPTLEKHIEAYLVREVEKIGGVAEKFTSPGRRSVPDRLVLVPEFDACREVRYIGTQAMSHVTQGQRRPARIIFVELKAPGKKPTEAQARDHERRRAMGFRVEVLDSKESVDQFIRGLI